MTGGAAAQTPSRLRRRSLLAGSSTLALARNHEGGGEQLQRGLAEGEP